MRLKSQAFLVTASVFVLAATAARADVTISTDATANMSCSAGVCQPTAADAVLNAGDLQNLLASGNVTVTTTGSGVQATNIDVSGKLRWSADTLTLDAYQSLNVTAPVMINGKSGLSILTNDGGTGGELAFLGKGHVTFKKLSGKLTINATAYTLVNSIASLAEAIKKSQSGNYALAADYDAEKDGSYNSAPISTSFTGSFEGLGNVISNLIIESYGRTNSNFTGLFALVDSGGSVSDIGLADISVMIKKSHGGLEVGALAGLNNGTISRSFATGALMAPKKGSFFGGLVGNNNIGTISRCYANVSVKFGSGSNSRGGGLLGENGGTVSESYATGNVDGGLLSSSGGLVGIQIGNVSNSYATGDVTSEDGSSGGLIGENGDGIDNGYVSGSYSTGVPQGSDEATGGLIGADNAQAGSLANTYWDTKTSHIDNLSQGAGAPASDPGITGLTTKQLKSGLPSGFDPSVWGENPEINNGLPYLLTNPPK
ncbi:MAG TPA: GLUG motif-containing protein [Rhizomicrobium sp.]|nr:GLUG motif-containing protein [Rhizomicrobium sp.]